MAGVAGVAVVSWVGGSLHQRNIQDDIQGEEDELERLDQTRRHLPGLPFGAHVSADTAVVPQTQSGLAIPARDTGVPPEPVEGASRVAQIMRFGFPGLDNIRSHSDYTLSYDRRNRVPHWVFEHLTRES